MIMEISERFGHFLAAMFLASVVLGSPGSTASEITDVTALDRHTLEGMSQLATPPTPLSHAAIRETDGASSAPEALNAAAPVFRGTWRAPSMPGLGTPYRSNARSGASVVDSGTTCAGGNSIVLILVEPSLLDGIRLGLSQFEADICASGYSVIEKSADFQDPVQLRSYLSSLYTDTSQQLKGAILVGHFPYIYQYFVWPSAPPDPIEAASFEFYADLNGDFAKTPDYVSTGGHPFSYNSRGGATGWEIWIGLLPRAADTVKTIESVNRYFSKNHAYRVSLPKLEPPSYLGLSEEYSAKTTAEHDQYYKFMTRGFDSWQPYSDASNARIYFDSSVGGLSAQDAYTDIASGVVDFVVMYGHGSAASTGRITRVWLDSHPLKATFLMSGDCSTADPDASPNILTQILYHPNSTVLVAQGATNSPGGRGTPTAPTSTDDYRSYGDNIATALSEGKSVGDAYLEYINRPVSPYSGKGFLPVVLALLGDPTLTAKVGVPGGSGGVCSTGTTLPLVGGRFVVTLNYGTYAPGMPTSTGTAYRLSDNVGYFGTVDPMSADVIVKIVDFCALNNTWSVYLGGTTDLQTSVSITDTMTGHVSQPFVNPLGHDFTLIKAQVFNCP